LESRRRAGANKQLRGSPEAKLGEPLLQQIFGRRLEKRTGSGGLRYSFPGKCSQSDLIKIYYAFFPLRLSRLAEEPYMNAPPLTLIC
jgi:hypothetical protein